MQHRCQDTAGLILRYTDCNTATGEVDWHGLGLQLLDDQWIIQDMRIYRSVGSSVSASVTSSVSTLGDWVTKLNLSHNYLQHVNVVCRLKNLTHLDLSENPLGQPLPSQKPGTQANQGQQSTSVEESCLPVQLFALQSLKKLSLRKVGLTRFPDVQEWTTSLTEINLAGNKLRTLPSSFGRARELLILNLADNKLDSVPRCIGRLTKLCSLNISGNIAINSLPCELGRLSQLISLDTKKITLSNIPIEFQGRPGEITRYLNRQLRHLEEQRVAKVCSGLCCTV